MRTKKTGGLLLPYISRYKGWIILNLFASIIIALIQVTLGFFIQTLTDHTLNSNLSKASEIIIIFTGIAVSGVIFKYCVIKSAGSFSFNILRDLRKNMTEHLEKLKISIIEMEHSGKTVTKLSSDVNILQEFLQEMVPSFLYNICVYIFALFYLSVLNLKLTMVTVALIPLTLFIANLLSKPLSKYRKVEQEAKDKITMMTQEAVGGIHIEKAYNLSDSLQHKFNKFADTSLKYQLKRHKLNGVLLPLEYVLRWIPLLLCAVYGGYLTLNEGFTTGRLFAFIYLLKFLNEPVSETYNMLLSFRNLRVSLKRINDFLNQPEEKKEGERISLRTEGSIITFKNVHFQYTKEKEVLKNITFKIHKGDSVAFVGSSGSGKSTILKLICGFYPPLSGKIYISGNNLSSLNIDNVRTWYSLIMQDSFLFPATIAENISYGKPEATIGEIIEAAKKADAHDFIVKLNEGYHSYVGERGVTLSGGQCQRIAIARAVIKGSPILILDEPTSSLDTESQLEIHKVLTRIKRECTTLTVAHWLYTIQNADTIYVLDKGEIKERGTHERLMLEKGLYRELYIKQENEKKYKEGI